MHSRNIKANTHNDTIGTLETPVWGKLAKRVDLLSFMRDGTAANNNQKVLTVQ